MAADADARDRCKVFLAFENRQVLGLHRLADGGDEDGRMIAGVVAGQLERHHQRGRNVLRRDGCEHFHAAGFLEGLIETTRGQSALRLGEIVDPCVVAIALDAPAGLLFHRIQPCVHRLLAALGADLGGVCVEGHAGKTLAVDAPQVRLIGMEIRRAEPQSGEAALGHELEVSARRIGLDDFLLDELRAQIRLPEMARGFLAGEEKRVIKLAAQQWRMRLGVFENRTAAAAFGQ